MRRLTVLAAGLLLAACASGKPLMGTRGLQQAVPADPDKKTCQRSHELGSNKLVRECHSQAEWAAMAKAGKGDVDELGRRVTAAAGDAGDVGSE